MISPDFSRPIAVGALITTVLACLLVVVQSFLDYSAKQEAGEEVWIRSQSHKTFFGVKSTLKWGIFLLCYSDSKKARLIKFYFEFLSKV